MELHPWSPPNQTTSIVLQKITKEFDYVSKALDL